MLETKRVVAYGKRSTRIIYVSDETRVLPGSPFPKHGGSRENTTSMSPAPARKVLRGRKVHGLSTSPRGSPKSSNILGLAPKKLSTDPSAPTPKRRPLGLKSVALPASPSIVYLGQRPGQTPTAKLTTFAPFVDLDAAAIGGNTGALRKADKGKIDLSRHTRELAAEGGEAEVVRPSRKRVPKRPIILSDDDDEELVETTFGQPTRGISANPIVVSDTLSDDYPEIHPPKAPHNTAISHSTKQRLITALERVDPHPKGAHQCVRVDASTSIVRIQPLPLHRPLRDHRILFPNPTSSKLSLKPVLGRSRSPRRSRRNAPRLDQARAQRPPSPFDLERTFANLSISPDIHQGFQPLQTLPGPARKTPPKHLEPLLAECSQTVPYCFSTFVETFPFDDLHASNSSIELAFRKIGEASYSEVFAIGDVVLKIVPLRDESCMTRQLDNDIDLPQESDARDVLQEVIVTRAMGQICPGFVKLLRTYVLIGEYPSLLLSLWDTFNSTKSSENLRPNVFPPTQAYALLVLPHGGPDLEAYTFPLKAGWRQACSIFWQTTKALAAAEELVSFEHRDLHWGQILVNGTARVRKVAQWRPNQRAVLDVGGIRNRMAMDHPSHGVTVTIIDLGLARMDATDGHGGDVHWTPLDELIFEGEGDYQFDIYRMMRRVHCDDAWAQFRPMTNVMWLHYLALKLLRFKGLRLPGARNTSALKSEFGEKECYDCLIETEQLLGSCISRFVKGKKNRRLGVKGSFCKAGDVVLFAKGKGWLQ